MDVPLAWLRAGCCPQLTASGFQASLLPAQGGRPCCLSLVFLPGAVSSLGPSPVWFSRSAQHQGRLSLDLSHRACSDYSEMRASHGSNSLPSSARLGNCAAALSQWRSGLVHLHLRPRARLVVASPWLLPSGAQGGSAPHNPSAVCCALRFPSGHRLFLATPWPRSPAPALSLSVILGEAVVLFTYRKAARVEAGTCPVAVPRLREQVNSCLSHLGCCLCSEAE